MIKVITALGSSGKRQLLEKEFLEDNIYFLGDDARTVEELSHLSENAECNICLIHENVLSRGNNREMAKKIFGNVNTLLILPGSRNHYVKEQIDQYLDGLGLCDIIYEGTGLNSKYFLSALVNNAGNLDTEVELDEKQEEVIEEEEISLKVDEILEEPEEAIIEVSPEMIAEDIKNEEYSPVFETPISIESEATPKRTMHIGVVSINKGSGSTYESVKVARRYGKNHAVIVDMSKDKALKAVLLKDIKVLERGELTGSERVVIYDMGYIFDIKNDGQKQVFDECDIKICMCFSESWHLKAVRRFGKENDIDKTYVFLFDKLTKEVQDIKLPVYDRRDGAIFDIIEKGSETG